MNRVRYGKSMAIALLALFTLIGFSLTACGATSASAGNTVVTQTADNGLVAGSGVIKPMNGGGGGVDVNGWCKNRYGGGAYAVVLDAGNPYSWRCNVNGSYYGVDMNSACVYTYGSPSSAYLLYWSAWGWVCY